MTRMMFHLLTVFLFAAQSMAQDMSRTPYFELEAQPELVITEATTVETESILRTVADQRRNHPFDRQAIKEKAVEIRETVDEFLLIGKKIWDIIVANAPVVKTQYDYLTVIPNTAKAWTDLTGWQAPRALHYQMRFKNLLGMEVVNIKYAVVYTWGGRSQGRGSYLANIMVLPELVDVAWGYKVNATNQVNDVVNTGTTHDPIPGVNILFKWLVSTPIKHMEGARPFFVKGDGSFQDLGL